MARKTIAVDSSGTQALRRLACHFTRRASRALGSPDLSDAAVHEARKDLKRSRTALRLLRPALGEPTYRRENALLRDAAHTLNAARDAKVLTQTLQSLRRSQQALRRDTDVTRLLRTLHAERAGLRRRLHAHPAQLAQTRDALEQMCGRAPRWRVGTHGWSVLGPAFRRIYKSGRRALPNARPRPTDRALHEWRKQVKYLRYALETLAPMRSRRLARLARQAEQLTDCLGEAHDLTMLVHKARVFVKRNRADLRPLFTIIDPQRERLTSDALSSGERLYQAKPRAWERQLEHYWIRWHRRAG
jgi:CHAD domain-containing protein